MSSVFAQVWFWALLAFLIGALLTWVLLVRPAQQRSQELERRVARPAERSSPSMDEQDQTFGRQSSTAVWPGEPPQVPVEEAKAGRPRTPWLESDSLQGLSTQPMPADTPAEAPVSQDERAKDTTLFDAGEGSRVSSVLDDSPQYQATDRAAHGLFEPTLSAPEPAGAEWLEQRYPDEEPAKSTEQAAGPGAWTAESEIDAGGSLPKRQRGATNRIRGGFEPPRPIQPSVRPVARRTPQDLEAPSSGSLFEPAGSPAQPGAAEPGAQQPPPARAPGAAGRFPPGPFGPGSAMPLPGGGRPDPGFTVKASVTALRYCAEDSPQFPRMVAEVWFASAADAERVGFRPLT
ncbi:MAG: hypothetical protein ACRDQ7_03915 [Haloechinothrix sp.]